MKPLYTKVDIFTGNFTYGKIKVALSNEVHKEVYLDVRLKTEWLFERLAIDFRANLNRFIAATL